MDYSLFDKKIINDFINSLNISEERKKTLSEKIPSLTKEEKLYLWKYLTDIYQLDIEEKEVIKRMKKYFKK